MIDFEAYLDAIKPPTTRPPADHADFVLLRDLASDVYAQFAVDRGIALLPVQTSCSTPSSGPPSWRSVTSPSHLTATPCS